MDCGGSKSVEVFQIRYEKLIIIEKMCTFKQIRGKETTHRNTVSGSGLQRKYLCTEVGQNGFYLTLATFPS